MRSIDIRKIWLAFICACVICAGLLSGCATPDKAATSAQQQTGSGAAAKPQPQSGSRQTSAKKKKKGSKAAAGSTAKAKHKSAGGGGNAQDRGKTANGGSAPRPTFLQRLEQAGLSKADAKSLITLVRAHHAQPKWVIGQLKNGVGLSAIKSTLQAGKAPAAKKQPAAAAAN